MPFLRSLESATENASSVEAFTGSFILLTTSILAFLQLSDQGSQDAEKSHKSNGKCPRYVTGRATNALSVQPENDRTYNAEQGKKVRAELYTQKSPIHSQSPLYYTPRNTKSYAFSPVGRVLSFTENLVSASASV